MKKLLVIILLLLPFRAEAGQLLDSLSQFRTAVRTQLSRDSKTVIDSAGLYQLCSRAIVYTSVDIGGVEQTFKVTTAINQAFYAVPDSIVEIMYYSFFAYDEVRSIKAIPPQFVEDALDGPTSLDSTNSDAIPMALNLWADTLQIIPTPMHADSLYLKCFVRHAGFALADSVGLIYLGDDYQEAALFYACFLVADKLMLYQLSDRYYGIYEKMRATLREKQARKVDMLRTQ